MPNAPETVQQILKKLVDLCQHRVDRAKACGESGDTVDTLTIQMLEAKLELARYIEDHP